MRNVINLSCRRKFNQPEAYKQVLTKGSYDLIRQWIEAWIIWGPRPDTYYQSAYIISRLGQK